MSAFTVLDFINVVDLRAEPDHCRKWLIIRVDALLILTIFEETALTFGGYLLKLMV